MNGNRLAQTGRTELASHPLKPTKDCRVCNRRRIKCDRTTPSCKKCDSRNLTCPGYGLKLNWDWGVASRGKLAGKRFPSLSPTGASLSTASRILDEDCDEAQSVTEVPQSDETGRNDNQIAVRNTPYKPWHLSPSSVVQPILSILKDSTSRRLFHHYSQNIAASLVWVDSESTNQWRTVMMPMALQYPSLFASVLALSAEHLSVLLVGDDVLGHTLTNHSKMYRDRALQILAQDMQSDALSSGETATSEVSLKRWSSTTNSILASVLMLCNMETVRPESTLWRVHLDAARTIVKLRNAVQSPNDEAFNFLAQQFFITDAFACTTSFTHIDDVETLTDGVDRLFLEFLQLVRRVTAFERQAAAQAWIKAEAKISPAALRDLFEQARNRTLTFSSGIQFATATERGKFIDVIDSFHHAGLLYSYRCLSYNDQEDEICKTRMSLFQSLHLIPSSHPRFAQDVVWPLFIAGTEAQSEDGTRALVEQKLQQAMKRTGFSNCQKALVFLRALWSVRDESDPTNSGFELNWIQWARVWASHGHQFIVF